MNHKMEEGKNQKVVEAFQIPVEVVRSHYCLSKVEVRGNSLLLEVVVVELSEQVALAGNYLAFQSLVPQVSYLEAGLKTPYVLLGVVVASLRSDLQVEAVRVHFGVLEVEAKAQYALREEHLVEALMMQCGLAEVHQGVVLIPLLLEVWVEGSLDGKVVQSPDPEQVVEAPFYLVAVVVVLSQMALGEVSLDVHLEQEGEETPVGSFPF